MFLVELADRFSLLIVLPSKGIQLFEDFLRYINKRFWNNFLVFFSSKIMVHVHGEWNRIETLIFPLLLLNSFFRVPRLVVEPSQMMLLDLCFVGFLAGSLMFLLLNQEKFLNFPSIILIVFVVSFYIKSIKLFLLLSMFLILAFNFYFWVYFSSESLWR